MFLLSNNSGLPLLFSLFSFELEPKICSLLLLQQQVSIAGSGLNGAYYIPQPAAASVRACVCSRAAESRTTELPDRNGSIGGVATRSILRWLNS